MLDSGDVCYQRQVGNVDDIEGNGDSGFVYVSLTRRDTIAGLEFVAGATDILASDELFSPTKAREFAALLIEAADLAEQV